MKLPLSITLSLTLPVFGFGPLLPSAHAEDFALVKDGAALAPLVLPSDATPRNLEAAQELADAIKNISGVEMEIIEATPANPPERAVWIGMQPGIEDLFPGVDLSLNEPEEIRIVTSKDHLLIAGRDVFNPEHFTVPGLHEPIEGKQREYGTANAVYTFLQKMLDVRWLLPGPVGEDYVTSPDITIPTTDLRYHPQFRLRMGLFALWNYGTVRGGETRDWARRQRLLLDSIDLYAHGHAFAHWWEEYAETRPELFALQPDGSRGTVPANPGNKKICQGEPAVWDLWIEEVGDILAENPMYNLFSVGENDNWSTGFCVDPRSEAWDPPFDEVDELVTLRYGGGVTMERPPLSDRYVTFANKIARKAKDAFPDRELFIGQLAYGGTSRQAPVHARPDDNVLIIAVHNFLFRGEEEREMQMRHFDSWSKMVDKIIWRPNMGGSSGWHWGTPDVGFSRAAHDIKWVAERGAMGISIDMIWNHWGTQGPLYYMMAQLVWNPDLDPDEILEDFCQRSYGPAAESLLAYWRMMEAMRDRLEDESPTRWRMLDSPQYYTEEFFDKAQGLLDQAVLELAGARGKYSKRLQYVQAGLDYTRFVIDTRAAMQRWEDSDGTDEEAKAYVLANWERSNQIREPYPELAIMWNRIFRTDRPVSELPRRRSYGLHPEHALTGRLLQEYLDGKSAAQDELE